MMIKVIDCKQKNYLQKITSFLDIRRVSKDNKLKIVSRILEDIKKYRTKGLIKYERKFSNNNNIKPTLKKINNSIKTLDPKVKAAIDIAYSRIS